MDKKENDSKCDDYYKKENISSKFENLLNEFPNNIENNLDELKNSIKKWKKDFLKDSEIMSMVWEKIFKIGDLNKYLNIYRDQSLPIDSIANYLFIDTFQNNFKDYLEKNNQKQEDVILEFINDLEKIPFDLSFYIRLPEVQNFLINNNTITISDDFTIESIEPMEIDPKKGIILSIIENTNNQNIKKNNGNQVAIHIMKKGYYQDENSYLWDSIYNYFKIFTMVCHVFDLIVLINVDNQVSYNEREKSSIDLVYFLEEGNKKNIPINSQLFKIIYRMRINNKKFQRNEDIASKLKDLSLIFKKITSLKQKSKDGQEAQEEKYILGIKNSLLWFFESEIVENETNKFIFLNLALEAILNDKNPRGTTLDNMMGRSLSCLIGQNHEDRKNIERDFSIIYKLRSNLVHGSKYNIQEGDRVLLENARNYLLKLLQKELSLLIKDF